MFSLSLAVCLLHFFLHLSENGILIVDALDKFLCPRGSKLIIPWISVVLDQEFLSLGGFLGKTLIFGSQVLKICI